MNFLTEQERVQLKLQHKQERDKRVCDRIKAILLHDDGWSPQQIAKVLLISDQAVRDHVDEYKASHKLKPDNGGSEEKLSKQQSKELEAHLQEHAYLYTKDIIAYAQITFGVTYTVPGLNNWLHRHGFSYKKPAVVPGKANKEQQEKWMKERVIYNTYYEHFEDFKGAIIGFFTVLATLAAESILGQSLRSRVKDKFRAIGIPEVASAKLAGLGAN